MAGRTGVELTGDGANIRAWVELPNIGRQAALTAWTDPSILQDWWGGELDAELSPGGRYVVSFAALGQTMRGEVLDYEPGKRLMFTWSWDHEAETPSREVDICVLEIDDGSRVELEHGPFGDTEQERADAAGTEEGWQHFLPRLASRLTGDS